MTDLDKLRVLLPHWIEHNAEHTAEFRTWMERAQGLGHGHVAEQLGTAIEKMEAANHDLQGALDHLGGALDAPSHDPIQHDHIH